MQADSTAQGTVAERISLARRIAAKGDLVLQMRAEGRHDAANLAENDRDRLRVEFAALPALDLDLLTEAQRDGLACLGCGASFLVSGAPAAVPVGWIPGYGQGFACDPACSEPVPAPVPAPYPPCPDIA